MLKVGDTVIWRGGFGQNLPLYARILGMEVTKFPRCKSGEVVAEVSKNLVRQNRVIFDLDNGHWCYSDQIQV